MSKEELIKELEFRDKKFPCLPKSAKQRYLVIENLYLNSSITKYMYRHKVCL